MVRFLCWNGWLGKGKGGLTFVVHVCAETGALRGDGVLGSGDELAFEGFGGCSIELIVVELERFSDSSSG